MKKITNPWRGMDGYHCYGCDPNSPQGLRMEFYENGDEIVSVWHPRPEYQGWVNTLHGGIQATLADEISSWVVFRKFQTSGVTSKMEVRYHKPIHTTDDHIVLRASVRRQVATSLRSKSASMTGTKCCARRPYAFISCFPRTRRVRNSIFAIAASKRPKKIR